MKKNNNKTVKTDLQSSNEIEKIDCFNTASIEHVPYVHTQYKMRTKLVRNCMFYSCSFNLI